MRKESIEICLILIREQLIYVEHFNKDKSEFDTKPYYNAIDDLNKLMEELK